MMQCGCDCGGLRSQAPVIFTPEEIVPAADIIAAWDAAINVNTAGAVSLLPDITGNGFHLSQSTGANQPTLNLSGAPNGNPSVLFDGVDDFMANAALDLPAPGTTPTSFWGVFRQITWTSNDRFWDAGGGDSLTITQDPVTPDIFAYNGIGGPLNIAFTLNTYMIVDILFSNSISDYIRVGSTVVSGVATGNTDPVAGFTLGSAPAGAMPSNIEIGELWLFRVALTTLQRNRLRAYATTKYGAIP